VVFLASDAAAHVNGQVFHSFGYGYALMARPAIRRLEPIAASIPKSWSSSSRDARRGLQEPIGTNFGKGLEERPKAEWKTLAECPLLAGALEGSEDSPPVCHANTCRSVMAHVLLEKMLDERHARSGCSCARAGSPTTRATDDSLARRAHRAARGGIHLREDEITSTDLRRHRELIAEAHLIVTMTEQQKEMLAVYEEAHGRRSSP